MIQLLLDRHFRRRVIFILVNLGAGILVATLVIEPIWTLFAERDGYVAGQRKILARLQAIAAQAEYVRSISMDTNSQMRAGELLIGANENVISADLQTRLKTIAEAGGAKPRAVQALPAKAVDRVKYSGARIEIAGPIKSIYRAVYDIESAKPYLFISGATIRPVTSIGKQGVPEEPTLQAQLDVFGAVQITGREQ
jgi:general secretion pathway protein M